MASIPRAEAVPSFSHTETQEPDLPQSCPVGPHLGGCLAHWGARAPVKQGCPLRLLQEVFHSQTQRRPESGSGLAGPELG